MLDPSVILLEFNELSPLMERFIAGGHLPNFQRLAEQSFTYVTDAEERAPSLEPWIQWITVYTGLGYGEHHFSSSAIRSGAANPAFYPVSRCRMATQWQCPRGSR